MGTWGFGSFDSDEALDFVDEKLVSACRERVDEVIAGLKEPEDEVLSLHWALFGMAAVEAWAILCEQCHGTPPTPDDVIRWKNSVVAKYDRYCSEIIPDPRLRDLQRQLITATFGRLERAARAFGAGDLE